MPCVISRASGALVWDPEGKQYFDFLSAYSAVNQGHCHPKILAAMVDQAQMCTLSSRAFYNDVRDIFSSATFEHCLAISVP
jgi:ornithine--oxo-acid transaminase